MGRLGRITWRLPQAPLDSSPLGQSIARGDDGRLTEVRPFGDNPGNLRMLKYVPHGDGRPLPLVVVLHGCTQTAGGYDRGTGWSSLADEYGFALLFPEQKHENNPKNCFTWFEPGDTRRGSGEAASIRAMIRRMTEDHEIDASHVFVTGLSAGAAMTSAMLATYPEVFAAGALIAGLPYGAAGNVREAFHSMYQGTSKSAEEWGAAVRSGSAHRGPWPRVSVWHGTADRTVAPANADAIIKQWTDVHEAMTVPERRDAEGYARTIWRDERGCKVVESIAVTGLDHGTPLAIANGIETCGQAGPFLLDVGISSTHHIARFFGLIEPEGKPSVANAASESARARMGSIRDSNAEPSPAQLSHSKPRAGTPADIPSIITSALRSAGLVR